MSPGPQEEKQAIIMYLKRVTILLMKIVCAPGDLSLLSLPMQLIHIGERNLRWAEPSLQNLGQGKKLMQIGTTKCQIQCIQHHQDFCQSCCYFLNFFVSALFPTWAVLSLYSCMILLHSGSSLSWLSLFLYHMPLTNVGHCTYDTEGLCIGPAGLRAQEQVNCTFIPSVV